MGSFIAGTVLLGVVTGVFTQVLYSRRHPVMLRDWPQPLAAGAAGAFIGGALLGMVFQMPFELGPVGIAGAISGAILLLAAFYRFEEPRQR